MSDYEFLHVEVCDGMVTVTLDRPPLNVLNNPMLDELNAALESLLSDKNLSAMVLDARGKAFCVGVDIADHTPDQAGDMIHRFHGVFRKLALSDALTIAVVNGAALGGGCELACFCDIVLASDRSKFGQPEVQVGVFPPIAACAFPTSIGLRAAIEVVALGQTVDADEARRIGLVNHVYSTDEFDDRVKTYLANIRSLSRPVVRLAKKATSLVAREQFLSHLEQVERLYLDDLMKLSDSHEGIAAFMEKRRPVWKHA